jgi:hypothetical protein
MPETGSRQHGEPSDALRVDEQIATPRRESGSF